MTNQMFCYWLQGYFEIAVQDNLKLDHKKIRIIEKALDRICEPLGVYTKWLKETIIALRANDYHQPLVEYFLPLIRAELNSIFYHVIDNSYGDEIDFDRTLAIHNGALLSDKS